MCLNIQLSFLSQRLVDVQQIFNDCFTRSVLSFSVGMIAYPAVSCLFNQSVRSSRIFNVCIIQMNSVSVHWPFSHSTPFIISFTILIPNQSQCYWDRAELRFSERRGRRTTSTEEHPLAVVREIINIHSCIRFYQSDLYIIVYIVAIKDSTAFPRTFHSEPRIDIQ